MSDPHSKGGKGDRDDAGRFLPGHRQGGPGNPHVRRLARWQAALRRAVTPARLEAVLRKLLEMAEAGDKAAIRILLDRTIAPADTVEWARVAIPAPADAASTSAAATAIMQAVADGRLSPDVAGRLGGLVELSRKAIETADLARRIEALEERATGGMR